MRISLPLLLMSGCSAVLAQAPAFEVASVRPSQGYASGQIIGITPGTLTISGFDMNHLLQWAYGIQEFQIQGPEWIKDTRFAITAKAADAADDDRLRLMLRTLLADRFGP